MSRSAFTAAAVGVTLFFAPVLALAEPDVSCLNTAISDRSKSLKDAYKIYSDDMNKAVDAMTKSEQEAVKNSNTQYTYYDTARAYADFAYRVGDTWNRLNITLSQAWNNYYGRRVSCGYGGTAPAGYGGSYSGYGYTNYNYGYGNTYNYGARCSTPVLPTPRAGCTYECAPDENGCQRCHEACRTPVTYSSCGCTPLYDPVCTRSGRSYDNACIAVCRGEQVWYDGSCR